MQIRYWLLPCSKQLFLRGTNVSSCWKGWCGSVEPRKVASLSPMMIVKPRNERACCSPQSVPLLCTYTPTQHSNVHKAGNKWQKIPSGLAGHRCRLDSCGVALAKRYGKPTTPKCYALLLWKDSKVVSQTQMWKGRTGKRRRWGRR